MPKPDSRAAGKLNKSVPPSPNSKSACRPSMPIKIRVQVFGEFLEFNLLFILCNFLIDLRRKTSWDGQQTFNYFAEGCIHFADTLRFLIY